MVRSTAVNAVRQTGSAASLPAQASVRELNDASGPLPDISFATKRPQGAAFAASSRVAGRLNAANVSQQEVDALLAERQSLVELKLFGEFNDSQQARLDYIRWSLDRIEDARYGEGLDELDAVVSHYEAFQAELAALQENLEGRKIQRKRHR